MKVARPTDRARSALTVEQFQEATNVSRETLERLKVFEALLGKWQRAINLVGPATLADPWRRHFLDSAQLLALGTPQTWRWVDLGSGAGFPGLVLAILGAPEMHLVESDHRKAAFLREAIRATGSHNATVHIARVQDVSRETLGGAADVITARALAKPAEILEWAAHLVAPDGQFLLLGGAKAGEALTEVRKNWKMTVDELPSRTDPESRLLRIRGVSCGPI